MRITLILLLIFGGLLVRAQDVLENSGISEDWYQIQTQKFRVVFPSSFQEKAQYVANLLDTLYHVGTSSVTKRPIKPITYVIRNKQAFSNGFVALGPRRSEFYTMPPQNPYFVGVNDWIDKLVIHEFRHVAQYQQSRQGITGLATFLLGENTLAGISYTVYPQWFWEGDAVVMETALTRGGRSRIPAFTRQLRMNLLAGNDFNYSKQYLGSYRDNIPNHYVLGSLLVPFVRKNTSPAIWEEISSEAIRKPYIPFSFSRSMKKITGKNLKKTYGEMMGELNNIWSDQVNSLELTPYEIIPGQESKVYTDFEFPTILANDNLIAIKKGLEDIQQIYNLTLRKPLHKQGIVNNSAMLGSSGSIIVWNEFNFDPRWRAVGYSDIKAYDFASGKAYWITKKNKFAGVDISDDESLLVTTTSDKSYHHSIVLLDRNGQISKVFDNPRNYSYSHVRFVNDTTLVAIRISRNGKSMIEMDIHSGSQKELIPEGYENFGNPVPFQNFVIYNSGISGIDNLYAIDRKTGIQFQITNVKFGAYNAFPDLENGILYFNVLTPKGLRVATMELDPKKWSKKDMDDKQLAPFYKQVIESEGIYLPPSVDSRESHEVTRYRKLGRLINPHSWGPLFSTTADEVEIGIYSQDVLSNLTMYGGFQYNPFESSRIWQGKISFQGFYPIFDFNFDYGGRSLTKTPADTSAVFNWTESNMGIDITLPFLLTKSKYRTSLYLTAGFKQTFVQDFRNSLSENSRLFSYTSPDDTTRNYFYRDVIDKGTLLSSEISISFINYLKQAKRHLEPRWGQSITLESFRSIGGDYNSQTFAIRGHFYFPGIFKSHSFNVQGGYQYRYFNLTDRNLYWYPNRVFLPRSVGASTDQHLTAFRVNYHFPLFYPDWSVGPLIYLKRVTLNGFYDGAYGFTNTDNYKSENYIHSTGLEIRFDFHVMRFFPKINAGLRYSYGFEYGSFYEPIYPSVNF